MQIIPDERHRTVDIPDMSHPWDPERGPVWQWLGREWGYQVSPRSAVTTHLAVLRGAPVTELARWEDTHWEMFAGPGPDITADQVSIVPLGTLIGADRSLSVALELELGHGRWRDDGASTRNEWKRSN